MHMIIYTLYSFAIATTENMTILSNRILLAGSLINTSHNTYRNSKNVKRTPLVGEN